MKKFLPLLLLSLLLLTACSADTTYYEIPDFTPKDIVRDIEMMCPVYYLDPPILGNDGINKGGSVGVGDLMLWSDLTDDAHGRTFTTTFTAYGLVDSGNNVHPYVGHSPQFRSDRGYQTYLFTNTQGAYRLFEDGVCVEDHYYALSSSEPTVSAVATLDYTVGNTKIMSGQDDEERYVVLALTEEPLTDTLSLWHAHIYFSEDQGEAMSKLEVFCRDAYNIDIHQVQEGNDE